MSHYSLDTCLAVAKAVSNKCMRDSSIWNIRGRAEIQDVDLDHRNMYISN